MAGTVEAGTLGRRSIFVRSFNVEDWLTIC